MTKCLRPVVLNKGSEREVVYPCRKCVICKKRDINEWYIRILSELPNWKYSNFLTLTYDDDNLPKDFSLKKEDLQKFLKRFRHQISNRPLKYFACGEYGDKTARAHYHLILFHNEKDFIQKIKDSWNLGMVDIGTVTPKSIRYVLKYVLKNQNVLINFHRVLKPFRLMSKGLGKSYLLNNLESLKKRGYVIVSGYKYKVPNYYRRLDETLDDILTTNEEKFSEAKKIPSLKDVDRLIQTEETRMRQLELNIITKTNIKKGKL